MSSRIIWSKIGLGTGTLASLGRAASPQEVATLIRCMKDHEISVIDTADSYGSGDCEVMLGKAIRDIRESFTLVTKAGYRLANLPDPLRPLNQFLKKGLQAIGRRQLFTPAYIERCLHNSLKRLKTDQVELFLLHDPSQESVGNPSVIQALLNLKKDGKTLQIGVSSGDVELLDQALESGVFDVIQTPAGLSVCHKLNAIWNRCTSQGIHVIGNHVFEPTTLQLPRMNHERLMRATASSLPSSATILCGTRKPSNLISSLAWAQSPMTDDELKLIFADFDAANLTHESADL